MMEGVTDRVKSGGGGDKIRGDQLGSLVNELIERMLAVSSSSTPDDGLEYRYDQQLFGNLRDSDLHQSGSPHADRPW